MSTLLDAIAAGSPRAKRRLAALVASGMREADALALPMLRGRPPARGGAIDTSTPYERDARCQALIAEHPDGMSREAVAELLDVSREMVRQIEASALEAVAARCNALGITGADLWAALSSRMGDETPRDAGNGGGRRKHASGVADWREPVGESLPVEAWSEHGHRVGAALAELERMVVRLGEDR